MSKITLKGCVTQDETRMQKNIVVNTKVPKYYETFTFFELWWIFALGCLGMFVLSYVGGNHSL